VRWFAGTCALPTLLGRSIKLVGHSGYWVNRSDKCFAMELTTERRGGFRAAPAAQGTPTDTGSGPKLPDRCRLRLWEGRCRLSEGISKPLSPEGRGKGEG
jgi:hypothetical protein